MIDLRISSNTTEALRWQAQLKEWCAAYKVTLDPRLPIPEIHEGNKVVRGSSAIDTFLKEYKIFMDDWNDCRCDKWLDK